MYGIDYAIETAHLEGLELGKKLGHEAARQRIAELEAAVKAALNMVDGNGLPPDWDWMRAVLAGDHDLFKTGDADAPDCIKDRNGEVVLGLCRVCGKGEVELPAPCGAGAIKGG